MYKELLILHLHELKHSLTRLLKLTEADESHFTEKRVRNGDKEIIIRKKLPPNFEQLHEDPVKSTKSITQIVKTYHNVSLVFSGLQYAIYIPHKFLAIQ